TGGAPGVVGEVTVLMSTLLSELDPVAPVDYPQLRRRQQYREDRQRDAHRTRVAELALVERGEVDGRREDLTRVVGPALARCHDVDEGVHVQRYEPQVHPRHR